MLDRRTLLIGAAAVPALAACAPRSRVRIGYQNGLLLIAKARGDLDAVARVAWRGFASGPPLLEAISVGQLDIGGTGDTPPIVAQAQGAPIVYVAAQPVSGAAAALVVPHASALAAAADLRGKRVAWLRGSSAERFARAALAQAGLGADDVEAVNLAPDDAAAAFAAGSLDAWAVWDPYLARAEVDHGARVLVSGAPLAASTSFVIAAAAFARDHGDTLSAILDTLRRTAVWGAANHPALAAILGPAAGLSPAAAARVAARLDLGIGPVDAATMAAEQAVADRLLAQGLLPGGRVEVARLRWRGWR